MRRRSRASSKLTKARSHKAKTLKAARDSSSLASGQKTGVARLARELKEAREQQVATADVLKVISRSPSDVQPVFDMIAESARRLCGGQFCFVYRFDGQLLHFVAHHSLTPEVFEMNRRAFPAPPSRRSAAARAILERGFVQIPDIKADPDYTLGPMAVVGDYRSVVAVPILRDCLAVGSIAVARAQAGLLPDPQIELLKTFADQAAIAIENVRLFAAEQQRTQELSESLEQQTATADVLRVISTSPGELEPVFQAMLENAVSICEAKFGTLFLRDGDAFRFAAEVGTPPALAEHNRRLEALVPTPGSTLDQVMHTKQVSHTADAAAAAVPGYSARLGGARSLVGVPMLKDQELVGIISIYRQEIRPFTDKQIELVQNFAAQAVIAIENARLLNEFRQSLEQQTATADVLKVVSSSPGDLRPVFDAMLAKAVRLCEAEFGHLFLYDGEAFHAAALHSASQAFVEVRRRPIVLRELRHPGNPLARMARTKAVVHIADVRTEKSYIDREDAAFSEFVDLSGARADLLVPMLKENELIGGFVIYRLEARPFTDKQIELVQNFAAQAVIAIENARLLNELRQSLEQQIATADVLRVISASPGDLESVFQAMLKNAVRICDAKFGNLFLREGDKFRIVAMHGAPAAFAEWWRGDPTIRPGPKTGLARLIQAKKVIQTEDLRAGAAYAERDPLRVATVELAGARTLVDVPMLKDNELIGAIIIYRQEVRPFTDKQVALVKNFAAQAVIAVENARLLNELRQRTA